MSVRVGNPIASS